MAYHTLTWLAWLCAAAYLALVNGQPLQTLLLILATSTVFTLASRRRATGQSAGAGNRSVEGWSTFLRFGLWVWLVATLFNLFFAHAGNIVLFVLPRNWPLVGGSITLEGLLYGLAHGASLFAVLLVFATFNLALDANRLLRWLPAGLFQAGLVVSIALSFVPQMMASLKDVREAQLVRGHKFRGLRDLPPLFVPLITTALERSLTLAESLEARGFGGVSPRQGNGETLPSSGHSIAEVMDKRKTSRQHFSLPVDAETLPSPTGGGTEYQPAWVRPATTAATLVSLLGLLTGLVWRAASVQPSWPGAVFLILSVLLLLAALYLQGRGFKRTHYRHEVWRPRDTWVSLACVVSITIIAYTQARNPPALFYYPYPPFSPWPTFATSVGIATLLMAAPGLLWPTQEAQDVFEHSSTSDSQHGRYSVPRSWRDGQGKDNPR
jgi:energy-coupling factor transport system permease protein